MFRLDGDVVPEIASDCNKFDTDFLKGRRSIWLRIFRRFCLSTFIINGIDDDARAALKVNMDAQDAAFRAKLEAMFKSPPPPNVTEVPAALPMWMLEPDRQRKP